MIRLFQRLWGKRLLLLHVTLHDIKTQYAGTFLGLAWIIVGPLLLLALYAIVYAVIFQVRLPNFTVEEYILNVFAGLVPFLAFSQGLSSSASCLQSDKKLLFNTLFPAEFIPIKSVLTSYTILFVGIFITILGDIAVSKASLYSAFIPVVVFFQIIFSIGLGMFISLLSLTFRDIQFLIQYIVLALLIATPITYTPDMIPEQIVTLLYINPLFYFVSAYQHLILLNTLPPFSTIAVISIVSSVVFLAGLLFFSRVQKALKDLV